MCKIILLFLGVVSCVWALPQVKYEYHNYEKLKSLMTSLADAHNTSALLYNIGTSFQGRKLWVMAIAGTAPDQNLPLLRPNVKYVGNMHGNEVVGREILLHFIEYLLVSYDTNDRVKKFLDTTRVHILPSMNPDGFEKAFSQGSSCTNSPGRENSNGFDLNRNFPEFFEPKKADDAVQPETTAVMNWIQDNQFVLSANLHGGALLANYPFDNLYPGDARLQNSSSPYSKSPDDDLFREISLAYARNHPRMQQLEENKCDGDDGFVDGITNGADWYPVSGGMQDYNYIYGGCPEITVEVACCKYPPESTLEGHWNDNRPALLAYLEQVHRGVKGIVTDISMNAPIEGALVSIVGRSSPPLPSSTTKEGAYWRLLLKGTYEIQVSKDGYTNQSKSITVLDSTSSDDVVVLDFALSGDSHSTQSFSLIPSTPYTLGSGNERTQSYCFIAFFVISSKLFLF